MMSFAQWTPYQRVGFCTIIVLFSFGAFFVYKNLDVHLNYDLFKVHHQPVKDITGNDSEVQALEEQGKQEIRNVMEGHNDPETIILIWGWPFSYQFGLDCSGFDLKGLHFTDNRSLYSTAHVVFFHHRDIKTDLSNMPKEPRPWFQKWVWLNKESPVHCQRIPQATSLFNITCNYRLDSTVPARYGEVVQRTHIQDDFKLPAKDKLVCWIVSNWNDKYKRVEFYNELKKHITINTYGGAFGKQIAHDEVVKIITSCKFYLSFENSIFKDYITEKLYNPLIMGTVPVVLGPSRRNYEEHVPGDSFIHYEDFDTPKMLADRLHYLDQNQTEYMRYHTWRREFKATGSSFGLDVCQVYKYLKHAPGYQAIQDLNKWFWG
ncbi:unnamed protein product [Lota lota]